jgi:hypothetical protein
MPLNPGQNLFESIAHSFIHTEKVSSSFIRFSVGWIYNHDTLITFWELVRRNRVVSTSMYSSKEASCMCASVRAYLTAFNV